MPEIMPSPLHGRRQALQTLGSLAAGSVGLAVSGCAQAPAQKAKTLAAALPLRPKSSTPVNACDCHHYIFDARFPAAVNGKIKPDDAPIANYRELQSRLGNTRHVIVQHPAYGVDNRLLLESIATFGLKNCRGIAVVTNSVQDDELKALHSAGVRGLRFDLTAPGIATLDMIQPLARRIAPMGWHIQVNAAAATLLAAQTVWRDLPVPVVFDHLGGLPQPGAIRHPTFVMLRELLYQGRAYIKLSGFYNQSKVGYPSYSDNVQLARIYARDAAHRMLWGSDWPQPAEPGKNYPDVTVLFDLLSEVVPNEATRSRILVDNPARLFQFG